MKEIVVYENEDKITTGFMENGILLEQYEESKNKRIFEDNIYCGIVRNVLPGMQSAFVDIGETKNAFIHLKDVLPKASNETGNKDEKFAQYNINKFLKSGMPLLVQVKKDEENQKGARITTHVKLTGMYAVLMPEVDFVTISQKIEDENEKNRIISIAKEVLKEVNGKEKYGLIMRTSTVGIKEDKIEKDVKILIKLWKKIKEVYNEAAKNCKPVQIYQTDESITKLIMGATKQEPYNIYVDSENMYENIESIMKTVEHKCEKIEIKEDIQEYNGLKKQMKKIEDRKIWLNCGGFITIDKTEALTAIDVNSGKFTGDKKKSKEESILKVNKEATIEIAKQLRLRNVGGIIVIDYIDMEKDEERNEILKILDSELKKDRAKTQAIGFTKLDLLEMTRKKI